MIMFANDHISECRHGKAPVKLVNANPSVPHLKGAAFDIGGKDRFQDPTNNGAYRSRKNWGRPTDPHPRPVNRSPARIGGALAKGTKLLRKSLRVSLSKGGSREIFQDILLKPLLSAKVAGRCVQIVLTL